MKMTLDEAIKHCEEVAENCEEQAKQCDSDDRYERHVMHENAKCAAEHRQLAEWLTELKQWRRVYGICPSYEMCIPECKEGYDVQIAEYKRLLKVAMEDIVWLNEHTVDGEGQCLIETATDMETCLACPPQCQ